MNKVSFALACAMMSLVQTTGAAAQSVPNYGNYQDLNDNFRIGFEAFNPVLNQTREASFEQSEIEDLEEYLNPADIQAFLGTFYSQITRVSGVFDIQGATVVAGYGQNSPTLSVSFVSPRNGAVVLDNNGAACSFNYAGTTRDDSFAQFDADVEDEDSVNSRRLFQCLARSRARFSPVDPLVGNPHSLQGNLVRSALDFTDGDSLVEQGDGANSAGDPWIIGGAFSSGSAGRFNLTRIDARVAKGWRVFEGNRARLKVDLPFSYTRIKGAQSFTGQIGLSLEVPVKPNWSIEPRVAYGIAASVDQGSVGHMVQTSVASRYVIDKVGRGKILIGNMAGYSFTLKTPGDIDLNPDIKNWVFRNGVAYELPLKFRMADRNTSLRASYAFTNFAGDKLYNNHFHEFTLSFGLRGREDSPKALRDVVRINFNTIQARGFSTYTAGLGFRF